MGRIISECPYCGEEIYFKHPIKDNRVDERDMRKIENHIKDKHPKKWEEMLNSDFAKDKLNEGANK